MINKRFFLNEILLTFLLVNLSPLPLPYLFNCIPFKFSNFSSGYLLRLKRYFIHSIYFVRKAFSYICFSMDLIFQFIQTVCLSKSQAVSEYVVRNESWRYDRRINQCYNSKAQDHWCFLIYSIIHSVA